ncbi:hypothetical protein SAMN05216559_1918 [Halomicrobium zhouii]|uniref:Uncharacterized protein n=1 Tax=Halomicrobium zhouii TaxID=767519 RepID=A0A1I6L3I1_9EURY|nr:hypothetical protein [Halomicrobium zhouii]SFR97810.1 hypothetical protein SAMN05216559_1918 [Halomicrobium zhouii]
MTQAADGEDELVIVTTDEYLDRMREQGMLGEIRNGVHQQDSDATVEFTTYGDLEG